MTCGFVRRPPFVSHQITRTRARVESMSSASPGRPRGPPTDCPPPPRALRRRVEWSGPRARDLPRPRRTSRNPLDMRHRSSMPLSDDADSAPLRDFSCRAIPSRSEGPADSRHNPASRAPRSATTFGCVGTTTRGRCVWPGRIARGLSSFEQRPASDPDHVGMVRASVGNEPWLYQLDRRVAVGHRSERHSDGHERSHHDRGKACRPDRGGRVGTSQQIGSSRRLASIADLPGDRGEAVGMSTAHRPPLVLF